VRIEDGPERQVDPSGRLGGPAGGQLRVTATARRTRYRRPPDSVRSLALKALSSAKGFWHYIFGLRGYYRSSRRAGGSVTPAGRTAWGGHGVRRSRTTPSLPIFSRSVSLGLSVRLAHEFALLRLSVPPSAGVVIYTSSRINPN
jgi:hypothetical protein